MNFSTMFLLSAILGSGCLQGEPSGPVQLQVFTPDAGAAPFAQQAVERIVAATGAPITIGPGGVPIRLVSQAFVMDEITGKRTELCADTPQTWVTEPGKPPWIERVSIELTWPPSEGCWADPSRSLEHEMIHAMRTAVERGHVPGYDHTSHGVFSARAEDLANGDPDWMLNAASLEMICEVADCDKFDIEE